MLAHVIVCFECNGVSPIVFIAENRFLLRWLLNCCYYLSLCRKVLLIAFVGGEGERDEHFLQDVFRTVAAPSEVGKANL